MSDCLSSCDLGRLEYRMVDLKYGAMFLFLATMLVVVGSCVHLHRKLVELEGGVAALRQAEEAR